MNHPADGSRIFAVRDGAVKVRLELVASMAATVADKQLRRHQAFTALSMLRRTDGLQRSETLFAHRKTRNVDEGETTKTAIGGE